MMGELLHYVTMQTGSVEMIETIINESQPICEVLRLNLFPSPEEMTPKWWVQWKRTTRRFVQTGAVEILIAGVGDKKDEWVALEMERKKGPNHIPKIFKGFPVKPAGVPTHDGHERMIEWFFEKQPCPDSLHNHVRRFSVCQISCRFRSSSNLIVLCRSMRGQ